MRLHSKKNKPKVYGIKFDHYAYILSDLPPFSEEVINGCLPFVINGDFFFFVSKIDYRK